VAAALILTGCQEDLGTSPAAFSDAPIVAEDRLNSVVNSVRKTIGAPAAQPSQSDDGTIGVDGSTVSVAEEKPAAESTLPVEPPVLEWSAPLTREDGSSLADGEIRGYQLYYRLRHQKDPRTLFIKHNEGTRLTLDEFDPGAYEFSITTVDTDGLESRRSEPVTVNII
jgi:hypothetical protein